MSRLGSAMRRFNWRSIPAIAVGLVCLWILGGIVWAMRPVWMALGRSALTFDWEMYTTVAMMLGLGIAARYASHVLDDITDHRWRIVGCAGQLMYRATRIVMWFMLVMGALMALLLAFLIAANAFLDAVGA